MPPALSEYASSDDDLDPVGVVEQGGVTSTQNPDTPVSDLPRGDPKASTTASDKDASKPSNEPTSKTPKRPALLAGLDEDNIIDSDEDGSEISPHPTSAYKTRAKVNGPQRSELCYDQAYHPMDEYVHPKRAAKVRSKYDEEFPASDRSASVFDGEEDSDFESDRDAVPKKKLKNGKTTPQYCQHPRRSTRRAKRDVIYDTNVHPQDKVLEEIEREERAQLETIDNQNDDEEGAVSTDSSEKIDNADDPNHEDSAIFLVDAPLPDPEGFEDSSSTVGNLSQEFRGRYQRGTRGSVGLGRRSSGRTVEAGEGSVSGEMYQMVPEEEAAAVTQEEGQREVGMYRMITQEEADREAATRRQVVVPRGILRERETGGRSMFQGRSPLEGLRATPRARRVPSIRVFEDRREAPLARQAASPSTIYDEEGHNKENIADIVEQSTPDFSDATFHSAEEVRGHLEEFDTWNNQDVATDEFMGNGRMLHDTDDF